MNANLEFARDYAPLASALLQLATAFASRCEDRGFFGNGEINVHELARETKARLEAQHEDLLRATHMNLEREHFRHTFQRQLDVIFGQLKLPAEVSMGAHSAWSQTAGDFLPQR